MSSLNPKSPHVEIDPAGILHSQGLNLSLVKSQYTEGEPIQVKFGWEAFASRYQVGLYKENAKSWKYMVTGEPTVQMGLKEGNFRVRVRGFPDGESKEAMPWSEFLRFEIGLEGRDLISIPGKSQVKEAFLSMHLSLPQRVRLGWKGPFEKAGRDCNYIFIGGAPRTGTTLLQSILCSDSQAMPLISEAVPLRTLLASYEAMASNNRNFPGMYFESIEEINEFFKPILTSLLHFLQKKYSCKKVVLKEPLMTKYLPRLYEIINDVRIVCMVRNPKAIIASMIVWGEKKSQRGEKHFFQNRNMNQLCKYVMEFYNKMFSNEDNEFLRRVRYVRYEDLVQNPRQSISGLGLFTGMELESADPNKKWKNSKIDFQDQNILVRDAITSLYGQPISDSKIDAYKNVLTADEMMVIENKCKLLYQIFEFEK